MSIIDGMTGPNTVQMTRAEVYVPTSAFRWLCYVELMCDAPGNNQKHRRLQQVWQEYYDGTIEWRDVPEVEVSEAEYRK